MSIYKKRTPSSFYRKIYKIHHGDIPIDENGRTFEIHHKDGNRENNDPSNLVALSILEHYNIHYSQGDWAACLRIATRMKIDPKEKSELARKANLKRISDGTSKLMELNSIQKGLDAPNSDKTTYCFENTKTKEQVYSTRYDFYTKYRIPSHHLTGLIKGHHRTVHGWSLITMGINGETNSALCSKRFRDQTIYSFENINTRQIVKMTSIEFRKTYKVNRGVVKKMVAGLKYNIKLAGWRIIV